MSVCDATEEQDAAQRNVLNSKCEVVGCRQHLKGVRKYCEIWEHDRQRTSLTISPMRRPVSGERDQVQLGQRLELLTALCGTYALFKG